MAKDWVPEVCNETSGFLFSHECFRSPDGNCNSCRKPVCEDHSHLVERTLLCTACAKTNRKREGRDESDGRYSSSRHHDDYDPYFYGGYYYGYGYYGGRHSSIHNDPNDFTEADAESLTNEADEDFENDMSES